jgi:hypothetical protein
MGTRSRIVIRHRGKADIYLWRAHDGYFSGVGADLCKQIRALLEKYILAQIRDMLNGLEVEPLADDEGQSFEVEDLIPFIEGEKIYKDDRSEHINYEYVLDFDSQTLTGSEHRSLTPPYTLSFTEILAGQTMTDGCLRDETASVEKIVAMFRLLSTEAECDAVRRLLAPY